VKLQVLGTSPRYVYDVYPVTFIRKAALKCAQMRGEARGNRAERRLTVCRDADWRICRAGSSQFDGRSDGNGQTNRFCNLYAFFPADGICAVARRDEIAAW
jgi:hypothetical protein